MNLSEFLHMGGYGFYVWTAYGVVALLLFLNTLLPLLQHRRLSQNSIRDDKVSKS